MTSLRNKLSFRAFLAGFAVLTIALAGLVAFAAVRWMPMTGTSSKVPLLTVAACASGVGLLVIMLLVTRIAAPPADRRDMLFFMAVTLLFGILTRLYLAASPFYYYDIVSYSLVTEIAKNGLNVYAETTRYNYSPLWLGILNTLRAFPLLKPTTLSFAGIVRTFVSTIDLASFFILVAIAALEKKPLYKAAALFYLNPVSFLMSGFHGQFENLTVMLMLAGVWGTLRWGDDHPRRSVGWLWALFTSALIAKHNIFYEVTIAVHHAVKRWWLKFALLAASVVMFLAAFIPLAGSDAARQGILHNAFLYESAEGVYGITALFNPPYLKIAFIASLFVVPFLLHSDDLVTRLLHGVLYFIAFTTGYATQYLVLPIAFGAMRASPGYLLYTATVTLFLVFGGGGNVALDTFTPVPVVVVWIAALVWFVIEIMPRRSAPPEPEKPDAHALKPAVSAALAGLSIVLTLVIGWVFVHRVNTIVPAEQAASPQEVRVISSRVAPGEFMPESTIADADGITPCGVFEASGHGYYVGWRRDFPACTGVDLYVLCFNENAEWLADNVTPVRQSAAGGQFRLQVFQDGTCGIFSPVP